MIGKKPSRLAGPTVRKASQEVAEMSLERSFILDDLRKFVAATEGWSGNTHVEVRNYWLHASRTIPNN